MKIHEIQALETFIALSVLLLLKFILKKVIIQVSNKFYYQKSRVNTLQKAINSSLVVIFLVVIFFIWGVNQSDLVIFISSLLTVIGVAFFAQWSILSNITATIIIFFNQQIRTGDFIQIMEKDSLIEGEIIDIGIFYINVKTKDNEEMVIPSNLFVQKAFKKVVRKEPIVEDN